MRKDLAFLPAWYADKGDCVFIDQQQLQHPDGWIPQGISPAATPLARRDVANAIRTGILRHAQAAPWGLSPDSINLFNELKRQYALDIEIPIWQNHYATLASRRTAARCLEEIHKLMPGATLPYPPLFFSQQEDLEAYLEQHPAPFIIKTPYSSSGRGQLRLANNRLTPSQRNRLHGMLRSQGSVGVEAALDRTLDFAMEFHANEQGDIAYRGLSVFTTDNRGAYLGNYLRPQSALRDMLLTYVPAATLDRLQQTVALALATTLAGRYAGFLGVDMLIYNVGDAFLVHPCVEINLRYTMGMAAIRLCENYLHPSAAMLHILYESDPRQAYAQHLRMQTTYPPVMRDGRLQRGYLSLCPVTPSTHFTACILAE